MYILLNKKQEKSLKDESSIVKMNILLAESLFYNSINTIIHENNTKINENNTLRKKVFVIKLIITNESNAGFCEY